ncbi:MAG: cysteine hydrolase family protein [Eubacteriales bacterium]
MSKYAVIVVDMLNDFVTGTLGCERGRAIIPDLVKLTNAAREHGIPVIYSNDCHLPGIDRELKLWGDHAIKGTPGAEVIPELTPQPCDYVVPKRRYSGFYQTDMQMLLSELVVDTLIITGLHTLMCCRHTSADAYYLGYDIVVPRETTNAFTEEDYISGLKYLKEVYGAEVCSLDELIARF